MSSQITSLPKQNQKTLDFRQKFKTEKCRFWFEKGFCPFNKICAFAHNEDEIRGKISLNLKYKTKPCHAFFDQGFCKYGDRCHYIHKIFESDTESQKTRSNSEQSLSSRSSGQQRSIKSSTSSPPSQSRHLTRYEMIKEQHFSLFQIMMGGQSRMSSMMNAGMGGTCSEENESSRSYLSEKYLGLSACQEKKSRMYSM